ncbi:MAG: type I polyketide synthase [Sandaracinus sp.]|nr:type I polyketide synthase [Sandaracinus sp.]MCB9634313.1 type I polyketide synthase [Sandaracinus sp.]
MSRQEKIAIVGIGCRFPGGIESPEGYWDFLRRGGDGVVPTPENRWPSARFFDPDERTPGTAYVDRAGFLKHPIEDFDASFFGISPREAATLDPQQRLLLEVAWEAFEDAGLRASDLRGSATGVYVGGFTLDNMLRTFAEQNLAKINSHTATSSSMTVLSNRLSYTFDLRGPSLTVDTACSSSLVAIHLACQALLDGQCDFALAGGVNVMLLPNYQIVMCKGHFLAKDGRSKSFDARADGYGRGEGAALVALKPLSKALADGDAIHGVILATGVNQDGQTDGISQPNPDAQAALIARTIERSGVDPRSIGYVEAHGTGTRAGDPVELSALGRTYGVGREAAMPVGSVKANFGHLEAAAGIAGLLKALLSVRHREVAPQVNFFSPNPAIDFDGWGIRIPTSVEPWPVEGPARAAVNSFGYGGTNAHVLLEEPPTSARKASPVTPEVTRLFPISARSEGALRQAARDLEATATDDLATLQANLVRRRSAHAYRAMVAASSRAELDAALRAVAHGETAAGVARDVGELVWLYTGMGPQWWAMGAELYAGEPTFRAAVDEADTAFVRHAGRSIVAEMFQSKQASRMARNDVAQPANFMVQVGLTAMLRERGPQPSLIVGHSVGEIAAAWAAGAISLDDAARIVAHRSRLLQRVAGKGGMLAVGLSADELAPLLALHPDVGIAAFNAPGSVTLSGGHAGLEAIREAIGDRAFCKPVRVEVAYHSAQMEEIREEFLASIAEVCPRVPEVPLFSTVTMGRVDSALHDADYWWRNAREPVRLAQTLGAILQCGARSFLEVGPHPVLAGSVAECATEAMARVRTFACMKRLDDERARFLATLGDLWCAGHDLRWETQLTDDFAPMRLPSYPWQRERFWDESLGGPVTKPVPALAMAGEPSVADEQTRTTRLDRSALRWLADHVVQGEPIVPGAAFLEAALAAVRAESASDEEVVLHDVVFEQALGLAANGVQELRVRRHGRALELHARHDGGEWTLHARAAHDPRRRFHPPTPIDLDDVASRCTTEVEVASLYAEFAARGLEYGDAFRPLTSVHVANDEVLAELDGRLVVRGDYCAHPALVDGAFQALIAAFDSDGATWLPKSVRRIRHVASLGNACRAYGRITERGAQRIVGDVVLCDERGAVRVEITGLVCVRMASESVVDRSWFHAVTWKPRPLPELAPKDEVVLLLGDEASFGDLATHLEALGRRVLCAPLGGEALAVGGEHVIVSHPPGLDEAFFASAQRLMTQPVRITCLTHDAFREHDANVEQRGLWGFFRVAMTEHPERAVRLVDVDSHAWHEEDGASAALAASLLADDEEEARVRGASRSVARVKAFSPAELASDATTEAVRIGETAVVGEVGHAGDLGSLGFVTCDRPEPGPGQVEVALDAMSLNFKDVMKAMGMLSDVALENTYLGTELGMEGAGRVVRVGPGVERLAVGDEVYLYHGGTLRSHVVVDEAFAVRKLATHDPADAATVFVFLTSWYALVHRANLRKGERVLIHSAAGGVGLSAIQIAQHLGAEVYATAGTEEKRALLREMGIAHVFDSRSLDWADELLEITRGEGVDVVLNALAGPAIERGMQCLRTGGRFVELGKQDIASGQALGMLPFNRALSFIAVDLDRMASERPDFFLPLCEDVLGAFAAGVLRPLPRVEYGASQLEAAFRALGSGEQIGKVVVRLDGETVTARRPALASAIDPHGVYLVTGGLDGFGLATARWLADRGARHLALASRRGEARGEARALVAQLRERGVRVDERALDVTDRDAVTKLVEALDRPDRPLAGVYHAAAIIDDATIAETTWSDVARVLAAKVVGAKHLDHALRGRSGLRELVLFSSISALVGNPAQAAYAAANASLEALAAARRGRGEPGLAVAWGAIGEAGAVARDTQLADHLRRLGIRPLPASAGLVALQAVLDARTPHVVLVDIDWDQWAQMMSATPWSRLEEVRRASQAEGLDDLDPAARIEALTTRLATVVAGVVGLDPEALEVDRPLKQLGLDSLVAVEIVVAVERELGLPLTAMEILAGKSLRALAEKLAARRVEPTSRAVEDTEPEEKSGTVESSTGFLQRILVHPPYYAFDVIEPSANGVRGVVRPDAGSAHELGGVSSAEAGRHLAIAGSCAASLDPSTGGAQHCYPVRRARLRMEAPASIGNVAEVVVAAQCTAFDRHASSASAHATMVTVDGTRLASLEVDYHVIPEASFRRLFADRARATGEKLAPRDAYAVATPRTITSERGQAEMRFVVTPEDCLGHFPGVPTLPVAIMGRYVFDVVAEAMRQAGHVARGFVVREAVIETHRFAFAGEEVVFRARPVEAGWCCDVFAAGELAASFALDVESVARDARLSA